MLIVTYDISDTKLRTKFSNFLLKFGYRLQYSVFEIRNSPRILRNIEIEIESNFEKKFSQRDSVIIFNLSRQCKMTCYGYAKNDEKEIIFVD